MHANLYSINSREYEDLGSLCQRSAINNNIAFNEHKITLLRFPLICLPLSQPATPSMVNSYSVAHKDCHRHLSVVISSKLFWSIHYQVISTKAYKTKASCNDPSVANPWYFSINSSTFF